MKKEKVEYDIAIRMNRYSPFYVVRLMNRVRGTIRDTIEYLRAHYPSYQDCQSLVAFGDVYELDENGVTIRFCTRDMGESYIDHQAVLYYEYVAPMNVHTFLFDNGEWTYRRPGSEMMKTENREKKNIRV